LLPQHARQLQAVSDALGKAAFEDASARGRALTRDEAIASALEQPAAW
jgi:hypothetical protein